MLYQIATFRDKSPVELCINEAPTREDHISMVRDVPVKFVEIIEKR